MTIKQRTKNFFQFSLTSIAILAATFFASSLSCQAQVNQNLPGSTLLESGTNSTTLQSGTDSTTLSTGTQGALVQGSIEDNGPLNILILVDASYSMREKLGGGSKEQKMDAAKRVLQSTIARIPNDVNLGLRVFGHAFQDMPEIDCQQTTLLVPIGTGNRRSIIEKIRQIHPYGVTPLTRALMEAGRDLSPLSGKRHVILISDGAETCGGNPCEYVRRLIAMGIKIKIDIVSMGLKRDKEARNQLNCVAAASGGKYYDSNTSAELVDNLSRTVNTALSGRVISKPSATTIKTGGNSSEAEKQINQMFSDK